MDQSKGINALSYLSAFFAPFIVPIIIYFVAKETEVRRHAKRALISHLVPVVLGIILFISFLVTANAATQLVSDTVTYGYIAAFIGYIILTFALLIWNVVQAIKVLR
ncbi:MAG: DUF4870 domain-containing protein [Solibacillus sp.]